MIVNKPPHGGFCFSKNSFFTLTNDHDLAIVYDRAFSTRNTAEKRGLQMNTRMFPHVFAALGFLTLFCGYSCTAEQLNVEPVKAPETESRDSVLARTHSDVRHSLEISGRFFEGLKYLGAWPFGEPNEAQCLLTQPTLRGVMTQGASRVQPSSTIPLMLQDPLFVADYKMYANCIPFSAEVMRALAHALSEQNSTQNTAGYLGLFSMTTEECRRYIKEYSGWDVGKCDDLLSNSELQIAAATARLRAYATILGARGDLGTHPHETLLLLIGIAQVSRASVFLDMVNAKPKTAHETCTALFNVEWHQANLVLTLSENPAATALCDEFAKKIADMNPRRP